MKFTHLHVHSMYSLLDGLPSPISLVEETKKLGMDSIALTDHGNMYGAIEFYKAAKANGIKPILGCEVYITKDMFKKSIKDDNQIYHLTLLAMDNNGYHNLIKLVSESNIHGFYYKPRIDFNLLSKYNEGLICLSGCLGGELSQLLLLKQYSEAAQLAIKYKNLFGDRYYIEIMRHPNNKDQCIVSPELIKLSSMLDIPMVATTDLHYLHKKDIDTHEVFLAINTGKNLDNKDRLSMKDSDIFLASPEEMIKKFKDIPEAINNTQIIADRCNVDIKLGEIKLPKFNVPKGETYDSYLRKLCLNSPKNKNEYSDRLEYELKIIEKTKFASYLLIVWDIIKWAKEHDIMVGPGRGSAAGSIICYLLDITNIDPLKYGLLFERFMNPDRISMPDIDMDFDDTKRDAVIKYVSDKYGQDNVAQIITFGTMFSRSAIRDAGRAMKYDLKTCDRIAKMIPFNSSLADSLNNVKELKKEYEDPKSKKLIDMAMKLEGVVRHVGKHACGVIISDKPITDYMPIQLSKEKSVMSQYDMKIIEDLGLLKMDFLGLRNLSVISECQKLIKKQLGEDVNVNNIPLNDKLTYKLLQEAKTTSVFQLESDGMKKYLKKLKPTNIDDISVLIALYRPGPMNLIPEYIARKHGEKTITYLHPKLEPILKDTYGIMIYQEQLISAVQALAGMTLAQADVLRKAVAKKDAKLLKQQESKFKDGCKQNKISNNVSNTFWNLIEPFIGYGFNRSHSTSYAIIGYQTAYLKANYPVQYMVAEMNSDDKIERITELMPELESIGIKIAPPDINISEQKFVGTGNKILFSLSAIKGMGKKAIETIIEERKNGPYKSIDDFIYRLNGTSITKKTIEILAKSGAFDTFGEWTKRNQISKSAEQIAESIKFKYKDLLPPIIYSSVKTSWKQMVSWEKELLGLYLTTNPALNYAVEIKKHGTIDINRISEYQNKNIKIGGVITDLKKIILKSGRTFYNFRLQDTTGSINLSISSGLYNKKPFSTNSVVILYGQYKDKFKIFSCDLIDSF